jgi:signal transduction histidine kinase
MALLACSLFQSAWAQTCHLTIAEIHAARQAPDIADRPSQGWEQVALPDSWTQRWPDYSGTVWYRIALRDACSAPQAGNEALGLMVKSINMAGEVYLNDTLLWRDASLQEPLSRSWNMPRYWILPDAALRPANNAIWIRVQGQAFSNPGLGWVILGPAAQTLALQQQFWWSNRTIYVINMVGSLCIAGLFGGIWLLYRKQSVHGWFALLNLAWVLFIYNIVAIDPWPFDDTVSVARGNSIAFMVFCTAYFLFIAKLLQERTLPRWQERGLPALTLGLSLLVALMPENLLQITMDVSGRLHFGLFCLACIAPLIHAWRHRKPENLLYALIGIGFILIAARDVYYFMLAQADFFALTPFANLITMVVITIVLGSRIATSMLRTERFNVELTAAVEQACGELERTMGKEHQLALSNSRLQERLQFIHDLHDGFGSALVRAIVQAEHHAGAHAEAIRHVSTLKSLRDDLRNVMDGGRTATADTPATPAEWMARTRHRFSTLFDELDVNSHWSCLPDWPEPPSVAVCLELTRLLEEALSNVLKHSAATEVEITLAAGAHGALTLEVRDNGVGFDIAAVSHQASGIGLSSMQARIARLGGHLHLESRPGRSVVRANLGREPAFHADQHGPHQVAHGVHVRATETEKTGDRK